MSTPLTRALTPNSPARPLKYATRALATIVFVGVQPVFTQVPPTFLRSISAVRHPALASAFYSGVPPCPEPRMIAS